MQRLMATGGAAKSNDPTNKGFVEINVLGPRPSRGLSSDLILLSHALMIKLLLRVHKNPEEPQPIKVNLA